VAYHSVDNRRPHRVAERAGTVAEEADTAVVVEEERIVALAGTVAEEAGTAELVVMDHAW